mgnify:CR=1 FL=1
MKNFKTVIEESSKSDKLVGLINKDIDRVDDSLSITDFALAVSKIVVDEYGSHLYDKFIKIIKKELSWYM